MPDSKSEQSTLRPPLTTGDGVAILGLSLLMIFWIGVVAGIGLWAYNNVDGAQQWFEEYAWLLLFFGASMVGAPALWAKNQIEEIITKEPSGGWDPFDSF